MNRKIKALGLALFATLAMNAVVASAASAKQFHSGSVSGTTYLTGTQVGVNQFDLANGANVKCGVAVFDASYSTATTSELSVAPTYNTCLSSGLTTTISMNGCGYTITTPTGSGDNYTATTDLTCPAGQSIKIVVGESPHVACTITIGAQTPKVATVDLTDVTSATANLDDILLKSTVEGVAYTSTGSVCGPSGDGKLTGEITFKGYEDAAHTVQRDLWIA